MKTQARVINALTGLVAFIVLAIAAAAFVLSYDALYHVALDNGQPASKAWLWPLLIDAPLVVFTLGLLVAQIARQPILFWAGLVILYTLATIAFNLAHAPGSVLGWAAAVVAPTGLLLTTEALRHLARTIIERAAHVASLAELAQKGNEARAEWEALKGKIEASERKLAELKAEIVGEVSSKRTAKVEELNAARMEKIQARRDRLAELLPLDLSQKELAGELGVSPKTVRADLKALNGRAHVGQDGDQ